MFLDMFIRFSKPLNLKRKCGSRSVSRTQEEESNTAEKLWGWYQVQNCGFSRNTRNRLETRWTTLYWRAGKERNGNALNNLLVLDGQDGLWSHTFANHLCSSLQTGPNGGETWFGSKWKQQEQMSAPTSEGASFTSDEDKWGTINIRLGPEISIILAHTLETARCHKLGSIKVGRVAVLALLQRLRDQFCTMFLHMGRHLFCHVSRHRGNSINWKWSQVYNRCMNIIVKP